jgi:hypothetical protein
VLNGTGQLYVFKSAGAANVAELHVGDAIEGEFVAVPDAQDVSSDSLQTLVNALDAFPFVRLEDGDYDDFLRGGGRPSTSSTPAASRRCAAPTRATRTARSTASSSTRPTRRRTPGSPWRRARQALTTSGRRPTTSPSARAC